MPRAISARMPQASGEPGQRPERAAGQQHSQRRPDQRVLQHRGREWHGLQRPDGARPAQLMPPQRPQRGLRHSGRRDGVCQCDPQPKPLHQPAEHVVVSQMIHQRGKSADPFQRLPPQRHGGPEAVLPSHRPRQQRAGEEVLVDLQRAQAHHARPPLPCGRGARGRRRKPGINRRHQPDPRRLQCRDHPPQPVRRHVHIGIGNDQHVVLRRRQHVDQIGHLAVRPVRRRIHHHRDVAVGKPSLQPAHDRQRRIAGSFTPNTTCQAG